ncbi:MAG: hypothetical protein JNM13_09060 [Hyphomicrobiaceae bacterium]|nr:hypothetical protein [Hyphomicrobiaceae bacterium]
MEFSLPGLLGAAVGSAVGVIDFSVIAMLVRRGAERRQLADPARAFAPKQVELVLKVLFVVNLCVFAGLGYWFGSTIGG